MIKSKKLISIFVSAAMLMTMLASFTTVAYADEATYTTHAWYTFENLTNLPAGVISNNSTDNGSADVDLTIDGKYGKGAKISKRAGRESEKLYPNVKVVLDNAIAIANGTTVEVEFDYYKNIPGDYLYIFFADSTSDDYNASGNGYVRVKPAGEAKLYHLASSSDPYAITMSGSEANTGFHRIKLVFEGSVVGDTKGWILRGAYFDGGAKSSGKWGNTFFTVDFKILGFRNKMDKGQTGDFGVDNISITSYPTPADGKSPVPSRHSFMNKVVKYTDKVDTPAYNSALNLFEQPYVTADDFSDALYVLESDSTLFDITDIAKTNKSIHFTTTDTTGGNPILVVGAYNKSNNKLYAAQCIKLSGLKTDGVTENKKTYDLGELPEDAVIKAFIFSSLDSLVPLAVAKAE